MSSSEVAVWPHIGTDEEARRLKIAGSRSNWFQSYSVCDVTLDDIARSVESLSAIVYYDGEELNLYANSPDWGFGGGASWLSVKYCDLKDITSQGTWVEGEAAELGTTPERFQSLVDSGDLNVWAVVAGNPACPAALIDQLVRQVGKSYEHEKVRFMASLNPNTSANTLSWLINRDYNVNELRGDDVAPNSDVRLIALINPATSLADLEKWSTFHGTVDDSDDIGWPERSSVAKNWSIPESLMKLLASDCNAKVREALVQNPCITDSVMASLHQYVEAPNQPE